MSWLGRSWIYVAAALVIAVGTHVALVMAVPHLVMARALQKMSARHGFNVMTHMPRPDATARGVVRPSPDLLYSACPFDLMQAPGGVLHVRATAMPDTYWSVSVFDADTNNIFVLNDRQAKNDAVDFVIVGPHQDKEPLARIVRSPTERGLVLFRTLIDSDAKLNEIDAARRHATCEAWH